VTQKVVPTGPWFAGLRNKNEFSVGLAGNGIVNPPIDVATHLSASTNSRNFGYYDDRQLDDTYNKMLRETDPEKQRAEMFRYASG
jgi:ABC-type transport system substrate-binding protein